MSTTREEVGQRLGAAVAEGSSAILTPARRCTTIPIARSAGMSWRERCAA